MRSGAITVRPSGFRHADAIFARNLFGATPADAVSDVAALISAFSRCATDLAERLSPRVLGDVEIGLVERQRLDERRDRTEDVEHLLRGGAVLREVRADDHEVRTQPHRARHRDRRPHAELPRFVARRRDDAATFGAAADRDRLAAQLGSVALFDRRVERVHVDVKDAAHGNR